MWGKIAVGLAFCFVSFLGIGSWWLMWRKTKDKREQIDIDKRMEHIQMVKIPPEVSERLRRNILRDIAMCRIGGGYAKDIEILHMPQPPKEPELCKRERGCITPTITKGGG